MSRSALVTGATGFIGSHLAQRLLSDGWAVHALVRDGSRPCLAGGVEVHRHDGTYEGLERIVSAAAPDVVFHLASLYLTDHRPQEVDELVASNVLLGARLAEAMCAAGVTRLVNTGTAWQHFGTAEYHPVNLYAATKQASEDLLLHYHSARALSVLTLKLFDTYGPGDERRKLVQLLIEKARSGGELNMSPGEQVLDLTHVGDVVGAFAIAADRLLSATSPLWENYFVSGERYTVRELVAQVGELVGPADVRFGALPYRPREVMMPVAVPPSRLLPGWSRNISLRETLQNES